MSTKNEEKLIELLMKENLSGKKICETLNIQRNNLPRLVNSLLEQNIIERNRDGQNYIYNLKLKEEERKSEDITEAPLIPRKERPIPLKKKLLDIIKEKGKISRADCINIYGFFNKHLTRLAKQLENEGEIKYTKFRRNVYYSMTDIAPPKKEDLKTSTQMAIEQIPSLKAFLHHWKVNHNSREATIKTYSYDILTFYRSKSQQKYFKPIQLNSITDKTIEEFVEYMTEKNYENSSQNSILAALHSYFNYCFEKKLIATNPMTYIDYKQVDEKLKVDVDVADLDRMELAAECYRDAVMMHFMLFTMLRVSEVAKANITDIKYNSVADKYYLEVWDKPKGHDPRIIPIPSSKEPKGTIELLNDYIAKRKPLNANENAIFLTHEGERLYKGTIGHMIKATRDKAGIQRKITSHAFRRGGARLLYERGTDILTLQKVLGHKHLNQTQKYIQTTSKFVTEQYAVGSGRLMQEIHSIDPDKYKNSRRA